VSKAALSHLTKVTAQEYGKHNIRVNALAPGIIETRGWQVLDDTQAHTQP
jgi:NAD(P)-dependent dehydrogenase (short-subunit alcohol dehydrogenase family)